MNGRVRVRLGDRCWSGRVAGGLPLHVLRRPGLRQKAAVLSIDAGSIDTTLPAGHGRPGQQVPAGAAHFLEHRLFAKPRGDISDRFARLGVDIDAHTTCTQTSFQCSGPDHLPEALELLLELAFVPHLTVRGIAREREIIAREIDLYGDSLEWVSYLCAMDALYPGHALATDIAGTAASIAQLDLVCLARLHEAYYHPANAVLCVCGDVDGPELAAHVEGWLRRHGLDVPLPAWRQPRRQRVRATERGQRAARLPVVLPHRLLVFPDARVGQRGLALLTRELALEVALDVLFGSASDFYQRCYADGIIDSGSFGTDVNLEPWFAFTLVGGDAPDPPALIQAVLAELTPARALPVLAEHFETARCKAWGHLVQAFDQVESCVQLMHSAVTCGSHPFDLLTAHERLDMIQVRDALLTGLDPQCHGLVRIDPARP